MSFKKEKVNTDDNHKIPDLYSLLRNPEKDKNKLEQIYNTNQMDDAIEQQFTKNNIFNDDLFIFDKEDRDKRLNEKDREYKYKKHFYLKDAYVEMQNQEMYKMKLELEKENLYIRKCQIAERKLRNNISQLNSNDVQYLIMRNMPLFTKTEKIDINRHKFVYKSLNFSGIVGVFILCSFVYSVLYYSNVTKYKRNIFIVSYGGALYYFWLNVIKESFTKKAVKFCENAKDRILDPENEYLKTPYDKNPNIYDAYSEDILSVYKNKL